MTVARQPIERERHAAKQHPGDQVAEHAPAKERFVRRNVVRRGRGIATCDQLVGDGDEPEEPNRGRDDIEEPCDPGSRAEGAHGDLWVRSSDPVRAYTVLVLRGVMAD